MKERKIEDIGKKGMMQLEEITDSVAAKKAAVKEITKR